MNDQRVELYLSVSPTTEWDPSRAQGLISQLLSDSQSVGFCITATPKTIRWSLVLPTTAQRAVEDTLYAFYPDIQIDPSPLDQKTRYDSYDIESGNVALFPLGYANERKNLDPLAPLVNAMAGLHPKEEVLYHLIVKPPKQDYRQKVRQLNTPSIWQGLWEGVKHDFGGLIGIRPAGLSQTDVEQSELAQSLLDEKFSHRLFDAELSIKIVTTNEKRSQFLAEQLFTNFNQFTGEYNWLDPAGDKTEALVLTPPEIATLWHLPSQDCSTPGIGWVTQKVAPPPPIPSDRKSQDLVTYGQTTAYRGQQTTVQLSYGDRTSHVNIIGRTGYGKTTLLHNLIHQDIANGQGVLVLDPQGGLVRNILDYSIPPEREEDVVIFDTLDKEYPVGFNLLTPQAGVEPSEVVDQTMAVVRKLFGDRWGDRMDEVMYFALRALIDYPGATLFDVPLLAIDKTFRNQVLQHTQDDLTIRFWQSEFDTEGARNQRDFVRPVNLRLRPFFRSAPMGRIVCQAGSVNVGQLIDQGKIILVSLGGMGEFNQNILGTIWVAKLQNAAMSRAHIPESERRRVCVYIDEVQRFTTTSLSKMFDEVRQYNLTMTVANQRLSQLAGDTLEAILGNVGANIMFRVGILDASLLSRITAPYFGAEDLESLNKYTTVMKSQLGNEVVKAFGLHTLPPPQDTFGAEYDPERGQRLRQRSREQYARPAAEIDEELRQRYSEKPAEPLEQPPDEPDTAQPATDPVSANVEVEAEWEFVEDIQAEDVDKQVFWEASNQSGQAKKQR